MGGVRRRCSSTGRSTGRRPRGRTSWVRSCAMRGGGGGWENGVLGYPVTDVAPLVNGGRFVHFQGGSIYWSPATGAHVIGGGIPDGWAAQGGETGPLGYPLTVVVSLPDGRGQAAVFQGGSIYWTQATGAHAIRG